MKRTGKLIFVALCVVLILTSLMLVVACKKGYAVTTQYNSEQGSVTVSSPTKGKLYAEGEQVTVTVTPNSNYEVKEFSVSGHSDAVLDADGKYTFAISDDTTIAVTFADTRANVTVNAGDGAHVTLNPQPQNGKLKKGTSVTVTVTVDEGYVLDKVIIGEEVQLVNNSYTFTVTNDVTIEVSTSSSPMLEVLQALRGNVKFEGVMSLTRDGESVNSTLITIFDVVRNAIWQRESSKDYTTDMVWGKCADGTLGFYMHNFTNGRVQLVPYEDNNGDTVPFEPYNNVFDKLLISDFTMVEDNVWSLDDKYSAQAVAFSISGYEFDVESLLIILTDDGVQLTIVSKDMVIEGQNGDSVTLSFALELTATKDGATISDEVFQDYPENSALAKALNEAVSATSYTASYSKIDLSDDSKSVSYNAYVTGERMWIGGPGDIPFGYVMRPDGKIWEFFGDESYWWLGEDPFADSLLEVSSNFDLGGINPSMFVLNDKGQYVLRDRDISLYSLVGLNLASLAAQALSNGSIQYEEARGAQTFAITLKDGKLLSVGYYCESVKGDKTERVEIEVVFSNFNTTEFPSDAYVDEDMVKGFIDPDYVGLWVNDDETFAIDISLDKILVNSNRVFDIESTSDGGYKFSYIDGDYTVVRQGDKLHVKDPSGKESDLRLKLCAWDNIFGTFSFTAYLGGDSHLIISVEISMYDVVVDLNGTKMTATQIYMLDGTLTVRTNNGTFFIDQRDVDGNAIDLSFFVSDNNEVYFTLYREGVEVDLSDYEGTYLASDATVKIDGNTISVWIDGIRGENIATDIHVNTYIDYDSGNPFVEICFKIEGFVFYIQVLNENQLIMFDYLYDWGDYLLVREGYVVDYSEYYGDYTAVDDEGNTLNIEEGKVTLVIDGVTYEFTNIVFYYVNSDMPRFVLSNESDEFVLEQYGKIPGYFFCYDYSHYYEIIFVINGFVPDTSMIDGDYYGYADDGSEYIVKIANGTITVSIDGVEQAVSQIVYNEYDRNDDTIYILSFVMNGKGYNVQPAWQVDGKIVELYFVKANAEYALFRLYLEQDEQFDDWSDYYGYYEGKDGDTTYSIEIGESTFNVTVDEPVAVDNVSLRRNRAYGVFTFVVNGTRYTVLMSDKNAALLHAQDGTVTVTLKKVDKDQPGGGGDDPSGDCDWEELIGTWYAEDEYIYTFEITADGLHANYDDIDYTISAEDLTFVAGEGFYWTYDGVQYKLEISDDRLYFTDVDEEGDYWVYLDKIQSGGGDQPGDCEWEDLIGTWYAEDEYIYTFEITADGLHANYDDIDYTISVEELTFVAGEGFYWTYDGVQYKLEISDDRLYFTDVDEEGDYWVYLDKIQSGGGDQPGGGEDQPGGGEDEPGDCAWADYIGSWYGYDWYYGMFAISADGLHVICDGLDYTISAKDLTFIEGDGFYWTYDGVQYRIGLDDDSPYFEDVEGLLDYWIYLTQVQFGDCAWSDYIGIWHAEDVYDYMFIITADGLHAFYDGIEYTISAEDLEFTEEGFRWTYDGLEYKAEISDDSLYFEDVEYETDYFAYLDRLN
ncbi:MAG: hypothetical protein J1G02_05320 [Clostridiales bacterium]|nr:hypothetical protein [Clostridiales bacterium]